MDCVKCKKKNVSYVICDACENSLCLDCTDLSASELKVLDLKKKRIMKFYCENCEDLILQFVNLSSYSQKNLLNMPQFALKVENQARKVEELLKDKGNQLKDIDGMVSNLKDCVECVKNHEEKINNLIEIVQQPKRKYSEVVKRNDNKIIIVERLSDLRKPGDVKDDIKKVINPGVMKVSVQMGKTTRGGGVLIKCNDEDDAKKVKDSIETNLRNKYKIGEPRTIKPRIKILGINMENRNDNLEELIIHQNKINIDDGHINMLYASPPKGSTFNAVFEGDARVLNLLKEMKKVSIGWVKCAVYEDFGIIRCYKCSKYGHVAKSCTNNDICPKCAGDHKISECVSDNFKCNNCVSMNSKLNLKLAVNHAVWDISCPCYKRIVNIQVNKLEHK